MCFAVNPFLSEFRWNLDFAHVQGLGRCYNLDFTRALKPSTSSGWLRSNACRDHSCVLWKILENDGVRMVKTKDIQRFSIHFLFTIFSIIALSLHNRLLSCFIIVAQSTSHSSLCTSSEMPAMTPDDTQWHLLNLAHLNQSFQHGAHVTLQIP